jgi:hypothetical protein
MIFLRAAHYTLPPKKTGGRVNEKEMEKYIDEENQRNCRGSF